MAANVAFFMFTYIFSVRRLWRRATGGPSSTPHQSEGSQHEGKAKTLRTLQKPKARVHGFTPQPEESTDDQVLVEISDPNMTPNGPTFMSGGRTYSIERRPAVPPVHVSQESRETDLAGDSSTSEQPYMEQSVSLQELVAESHC